jgi:diamine N-acetyltransferase
MRPSIKNIRAIKTYQKAGFEKSDKTPNMYLKNKYETLYGDGDYGVEQTALLIKVYT